MSQTLSAGITRDRAFELLNEHNKDPFQIGRASCRERV